MADNNDSAIRYPAHDSFLFEAPSGFWDPFEQCDDNGGDFREPLAAFKANLKSAILVGSIPFQLVHSSVLRQRFNQIHMAENIRSLKTVKAGEVPGDEEKAKAYRRAEERMKEELQDAENLKEHAKSTLDVLGYHLLAEEFSMSADEVLRQILVMGWGGFEALVNDVLRVFLNANPSKASHLLSEKSYKDAIFGKDILQSLENHRFDLSRVMGDLFVGTIRIDALEKIREICNLVFSDGSLMVALKNSELWKLSQQRHLIVHKRGIVDTRYVRNTGENLPLGHLLKFTADQIEANLVLIRDTGIALVRAGQSSTNQI